MCVLCESIELHCRLLLTLLDVSTHSILSYMCVLCDVVSICAVNNLVVSQVYRVFKIESYLSHEESKALCGKVSHIYFILLSQ